MTDFYRSLPNDRPGTWFEEFRAELISDHRQLLARRDAGKGRDNWSFDQARKRTQDFYRERFSGYHKAASISQSELQHLLGMVEALGTPDFEA